MVRPIFFLISNKILLKRKKSHPRTQGVYKGEQIKNENYKSQVNPKEIKKGFSKQRTIQVIVPIHDLEFIILPTLTTLLYKGITSLLSTSLGHSPISSFITSSSTN